MTNIQKAILVEIKNVDYRTGLNIVRMEANSWHPFYADENELLALRLDVLCAFKPATKKDPDSRWYDVRIFCDGTTEVIPGGFHWSNKYIRKEDEFIEYCIGKKKQTFAVYG